MTSTHLARVVHCRLDATYSTTHPRGPIIKSNGDKFGVVVDQGISGGPAVAEAQSNLTVVGAHACNPTPRRPS
jgi:hypothetical protein